MQFSFLLDVPVPYFTPSTCDQCSHREIELVAGSNSLAAISSHDYRYLSIFVQNKQFINFQILFSRLIQSKKCFICMQVVHIFD